MEERYGLVDGSFDIQDAAGALGGVVMVAGAYKSNRGILSWITMLLVTFSDVLAALVIYSLMMRRREYRCELH